MDERYFYSPTTGGFYLQSDKGQYEDSINGWPVDAVEITQEEYQTLITGQENGQVIVPGDDGKPELTMPAIDHEASFGTQKEFLQKEAERVIGPLDRAVKYGMATEEETSQLEAWEKYSVLLSRVNPQKPEWPMKPGEIATSTQNTTNKRTAKAARR